MRVVVTGADGRLGRCLVEKLQAANTTPIPVDEGDFDIVDAQAVGSFMRAAKPNWVIHTAAWTDVDGCARDPARANAINGSGTGNVAEAAHAVGAPIIYISTNEVFDGQTDRPYTEDDPPHPANPYGYSKWLGEQAVRQAAQRFLIIRTAWLFAHGGKNFIQSILMNADAGKPLRVVTDEISNPTYNDDLADAVVALLQRDASGIVHITNSGYCSRYEFARRILDLAGYAHTPIQPIQTAEWQRPSTPPAFSALENRRAKAAGVELRPWQAALSAFLQREGLLKV